MVVAAVLKKEVKQEETRMVAVKTERNGTVAAVVVKKEIQVNKKKRASTTHLAVRDGGQARPAFHSGRHITRAELRAAEEQNQQLMAYIEKLEAHIMSLTARLTAVECHSDTQSLRQ